MVINGTRKQFGGELEVCDEDTIQAIVNGCHVPGSESLSLDCLQWDAFLCIAVCCTGQFLEYFGDWGEGQVELCVDLGHAFQQKQCGVSVEVAARIVVCGEAEIFDWLVRFDAEAKPELVLQVGPSLVSVPLLYEGRRAVPHAGGEWGGLGGNPCCARVEVLPGGSTVSSLGVCDNSGRWSLLLLVCANLVRIEVSGVSGWIAGNLCEGYTEIWDGNG